MAAALSADWPLTDWVGALMTTRAGGASAAPFGSNNLGIYVGDVQASHNRDGLQALLALPGEPLWLRQVHGTDCLYGPETVQEAECDAVWTDKPHQVLAVQTADCLPVLFAGREGRAVAAAHAGWRGLRAGVLENTLASLPVPASEVMCWLGVSIGACCFEVGAEVRTAFVAEDPAAAAAFRAGQDGKWMADLYALARLRLQRAGVAGVWGGGACTSCDAEQFFSYRRDAGQTGRMATLVWIKGERNP